MNRFPPNDRDEELIQALAAYLEALEGGHDAEAVLRSHPEVEGELRVLAGLDATLTFDVPEKSLAERRAASQKFLATIERDSLTARALAWFRPRLFFVIGALGLGAGLTGAFASGALPSDPLDIALDAIPMVGESHASPGQVDPPPAQGRGPRIKLRQISGTPADSSPAQSEEASSSSSQQAGVEVRLDSELPGPGVSESQLGPLDQGPPPFVDDLPPMDAIEPAVDASRAVLPSENAGEGNGPPEANPGQGNGPPADNPGQGNGPPADNPGEGNGPPADNPGEGNEPPADNPGQGNGPPADNPDGPPADNPGQGNGPPADNPGQGNGPPADNPGQGNGPPADNPGQGNGPPADNPGQGNGPPGGGG